MTAIDPIISSYLTYYYYIGYTPCKQIQIHIHVFSSFYEGIATNSDSLVLSSTTSVYSSTGARRVGVIVLGVESLYSDFGDVERCVKFPGQYGGLWKLAVCPRAPGF